jgi:hypothetical protein
VLAIVISSFGLSFSPDELCGWRAKLFTEREDQFQQLIGDALHEVHGATVHLSPTLGRDGSIDAWIEQPVSGCDLLSNLNGPVIIECKDHKMQPTWDATWRNIQAGWGTVRKKLEQQAAEGFSGKFEPWRRAYVYCISATIPDQHSKDNLKSKITSFIQTIAPHITNIVVCDWDTLSFWLNKQRRIADSWLGVGHPAITEHLQYINSLTGLRQYLLNKHLPYEAPDVGTETHPDLLWEFLSEDNVDHQPGLVIHGPGGVGKTRLCLEIASRAYERGWRVLHLCPIEESLSERDLTSVIVTDTRPTLLCLDYIDFMQNTDYLIRGIRLVREAASHGTHLRYLANSRPIWAQTTMRETAALETFSFRKLHPTEEVNERLLRRMVASVAPNALAKWGFQELRHICGHRPIIALYILREIEDRFKKGLLRYDELAAVGCGDLSAWLRRRLAQDELTIQQPESVWEASAPSNEMVAACGALLTAPDNNETLLGATAAVLNTLGSGTDASFVLNRLIEMGWLELRGSWFATPHDVVTDEVLDQVARDGNSIRSISLEALLSLWICEPAAIGRLASALQRWVGAMPEGHPAIEKAKAASIKWLLSHAKEIGALLATGEPDRTSFALGAILRWPPWLAMSADCWDELFFPWIAVHGQLKEARHIFYIGLHETSLANRLLTSALAWLEACQEERDASYVLAPLLERKELQVEQLEAAIRHALAWLGQYPLEKEAKFVIAPLLERKELQVEQWEAAIRHGLAWLGQYSLEKEAGFVLAPLLERKELQVEQWKTAIRYALAWLGQYSLEKDAYFVLHALLGRGELQGEQLDAAIRHALAWLGQYPLKIDAGFVLPPLLHRKELVGADFNLAIRYALDWLRLNLGSEGADFIFNRVLRRVNTSDADWLFAAQIACDWLRMSKRHPRDIDHAFNSLLRRPTVLPPSLLAEVIRIGLNLWPSIEKPENGTHLRNGLLRGIKHLPEADPLRRGVDIFFSTLDLRRLHSEDTENPDPQETELER